MSSHAKFRRSVLLSSGEIQAKYSAEWLNFTNSVRYPGNVNNFTCVIGWRLKLLGGVLTSSSYCTWQYKGFAMCGAVTAGLQISKIFQIDKKDDLSG